MTCRLKGRDTTDQSIFGISEVLTRITTHHTRTRTSLFNIYTSQTTPNHHTTRNVQKRKNSSSFGGCCRTPTSTKITRKHRLQFLGRMLQNSDKYENYRETSTSVLGPDLAEHRHVRKLPGNIDFSSWAGCCRTPTRTKITRKHRLQFLRRMLQRQKRQKSPSFIVKTLFKSIGEHRKV